MHAIQRCEFLGSIGCDALLADTKYEWIHRLLTLVACVVLRLFITIHNSVPRFAVGLGTQELLTLSSTACLGFPRWFDPTECFFQWQLLDDLCLVEDIRAVCQS